jgi:CheY-like chemotaxis protein
MKANQSSKPIHILIADDDEEDRMLIKQALLKNQVSNPMHFVENGEEVLDFLHNRNKFTSTEKFPRPGLILLDLNMPKMDGREAIIEIKKEAALRSIPIIVLTTSSAEEDIVRSYNLGVSSFITKPVTFNGFTEVMKTLNQYWLEVVELPPSSN